MENRNLIDSQNKTRYKTVLLGDSRVGKTSIKRSYLGFDFIDNYEMTIGVEISTKSLDSFLYNPVVSPVFVFLTGIWAL